VGQHQDDGRSLLRLLYFRPGHSKCTTLDETLFDVAVRHRDRVRLVVHHSDECGHLFGRWVDGRAPTVLRSKVGGGRCCARTRSSSLTESLAESTA
jgi:hypothetical protein